MKPARFRYYRAGSLQEAVDLLNGPAANGKVLAGGQSLVPLLNLRLARPEALVDLNRVPGLSYIRGEDSEIVIGAMTRHREMEFSPLLAKELPILAEVMPQIGHPAIRNRGTLGGSVAHADPAAELPCVLTALDANFVSAGPNGERTVAADDFFVGFYATALVEQEILKEVRIPVAKRPAGWSFMEFARRHGDFAIAEVSVVIYSEDFSNRCTSARVVVGGGSVERPLRINAVEKLVQEELSPTLQDTSLAQVLKQAGALCEAEIKASGVGRAESDYLTHLAGVLTRRAVEAASKRWREP
jgi:2-furoyl-CoA dehydrogenase FAD binding subunit